MTENWKSENWDALIRGEDCPVCELIQSDRAEDDHGIMVMDLSFSRLFLQKNQFVQGYCVLMCHWHVIEPAELSEAERAKYFNDVALVGRGLQQVFKADKLNYNILGNIVPHLHTHLLPRYFTDEAPNRPIDPGLRGHEVFLSASGYDERIQLIRDHLGSKQIVR